MPTPHIKRKTMNLMNVEKKCEMLLYQKKEIGKYCDVIIQAKHKMMKHKQNLNSHWKGEEILGINRAIDDVIRRLQRVSHQLEDIEAEIVHMCEKSCNEEQ